MDKAQIKKMLQEYNYIMPEVRELNEKINEIIKPHDTLKANAPKDIQTSPTHQINNPVLDLLVKYESMTEGYKKRINQLLDQKRDTEHMLYQLDPIERRIIELRYINSPNYRCDVWGWVADKSNYDRRWAIRIHDRAIEKMINIYKT